MTFPPPPGTPPASDQPPIQAYVPPADYPAASPPGSPPPPSGYPPTQPPGYPPTPGRPPGQAYPMWHGHHGHPGHPGYPAARPNEALALASLIVSCVAIPALCLYDVGGLIGVVGAILGHMARGRIRLTGANGDGMALAGVVTGWIAAGVGLLIVAGLVTIIAIGANADPGAT